MRPQFFCCNKYNKILIIIKILRFTKEGLEVARDNIPIAKFTRTVYPRPSFLHLEQAVNNSLSFLIVRHPFERLISAYGDKFLYNGNKFYESMGMRIVGRTRIPVCIKSSKNNKEYKNHVSSVV